jgi:zinc transport system substrate-binding protein
MKKIILILLLLHTLILAKINTIVSILPEKTFVHAIGGDKVNITLMVLPGNSPHTYEPKPSQMKEVAKADIYFAIGVEFENVWLHKFKDLNKKIQVTDLSEGIEKLPMASHHDTQDIDRHRKKDKGTDPHIWTIPTNVKIIAKRIYETLVKIDKRNESYYKKNYETFISRVEETDRKIQNILSVKPQGTKFMVFHPSWGYFAKAYGLVQLPVEIEGKSPKPRVLISLIKEAKKEHVSAIFTQPEFSDAIAKVLANELHINVIKVSPLAPNWSENLIKIADAIAGQ